MQEKTTIFIFTTAFLPLIGGSEIAIDEVTRRLPDFEFEIITAHLDPTLPRVERRGNARIHRVGSALTTGGFIFRKNFFPISAFLKARQLSRNHKPSAIHAFQASQAAGGAWLFKFFYPSTPFILTIQEGKDLKAQGGLVNIFRNMIIRSADRITVISNYLKDYIQSVNSMIPVDVIPNGVDTSIFRPTESGDLKNQLGVEGSRVILTVSRLVEKNGISDLIKAFNDLCGTHPDYRLVIIGTGPLKARLEKQIAPEAVGKVLFLGSIPNQLLPRYISMADVFVRPSLSEGLGISFLEAMACETSVIATNVGGIPDFITNEETGLFCKVGNPKDIAEKIERLMNDSDLAQRIGKNGRALIEKDYQWTGIAEKYQHTYRHYGPHTR